MKMVVEERGRAFLKAFPQYAPLIVHNGRLYGTWVIGALYRKRTGYYGEFPYSVKERIMALFPDCQKIMFLFGGVVDQPVLLRDYELLTFDIKPELKPTICDDVRNLKRHEDIFRSVDLTIADPPYEKKDFERYGEEPFSKPQVIRDLGEVMRSGSFLVWLDLMVPMYSKKTWELLGHIGLVVSTNTRVRMLSLWQHT